MKKLYNDDGTLTSDANFLIGIKPENITRREWVKLLKNFRSQLSQEEIKDFEKIRKKESYLRCFAKRSETGKKYYQLNKQKVLQQHKEYYRNNKQEQMVRCYSWVKNNRQRYNQIATNYRKSNPQKIKQSQNKWHSKNPNKRKEYRKKQRSKHTWKLRMAVSSAFERIKQNKPANTLTLLGCTWEEAKAHIESLWLEGMTWENHGRYGWHIDHIRPVSSFKEDELHLMNRIENLQPLWAEDNLSKSNKY